MPKLWSSGVATGRSARAGPTVSFACMPEDVTVIDTIGAGDAFNAGFLLAAARDESMQEAVQRGVNTASAAISTAPRSYAGAAMIAEGYSL